MFCITLRLRALLIVLTLDMDTVPIIVQSYHKHCIIGNMLRLRKCGIIMR